MQCTRVCWVESTRDHLRGREQSLFALRCVLCGDIIDRVIILNRQRRRLPYPNRTQTPVYGSDRWKKNRPSMVLGRCEHAIMDRNKFAKQLELGWSRTRD